MPTRTQLHAGNSKKIDAKVVMTEEHSVESLFYQVQEPRLTCKLIAIHGNPIA